MILGGRDPGLGGAGGALTEHSPLVLVQDGVQVGAAGGGQEPARLQCPVLLCHGPPNRPGKSPLFTHGVTASRSFGVSFRPHLRVQAHFPGSLNPPSGP